MKTCVLFPALSIVTACGSAFAGESTSPTRDEVRAVVAEMLADADQRTSLLADGAAGGGRDEKGFYLSDGGANRLQIGGAIQFRYNLNFRDSQDGGPNAAANRGNDDFESGFQTNRTRLWVKGNVVDPHLFYEIHSGFRRNNGDFELLDAYAGYKWDCGCWLKWGQFKLPFLREELVSDWRGMGAERSITNAVFTQDRSQGLEGGYRNDNVSLAVAFNDGFNSKNSEFGSTSGFGNFGFVRGGAAESDWGVTGRLQWKIRGEWDQFEDFTGKPEQEYACMLGFAAHVEGSANDITTNQGGIDTQGDTVYSSWTADLSVEGDGWTLYVAGIGAHQQTDLLNVGEGSSDDYGLVAQGGFYLPDTDWELFARYDAVFMDSSRGAEHDTFDVVTLGANWYWHGFAARFTFDVQWFLDPSSPLVRSNAGAGFLATTEEDEVNVRAQFQLVF